MLELTRVRELTPKKIVGEWWEEVKENEEDFWANTDRHLRDLLKQLMESTMDAEMQCYTGAEWHKRTEKRIDYRNGYRYRDYLTKNGPIRGIRVPRLRKERFRTKVFKNYQARQEAVDKAIRDVFMCGVSTRRVGESLSALLDAPISASTVSNVSKSLNKYVKEYHNRRIDSEYQYLILDAVYLSIRGVAKAKKKAVLVAYGITMFGERELIDFQIAGVESEAKWERFLTKLWERGLKGKYLKLITTDGHKGLKRALETVFSEVRRQACWAHKLRNVSNYLPKKHRKECISEARKIYLAKNKVEAAKVYKAWASKWIKIKPQAVRCIERELDELLAFMDCPEKHRIKVRTTNVIERAFREVRRRVRTMNCFRNEESCERIIYCIFNHLNNHWKQRLLRDFNQFSKVRSESQ